jgi:hypothetical protein
MHPVAEFRATQRYHNPLLQTSARLWCLIFASNQVFLHFEHLDRHIQLGTRVDITHDAFAGQLPFSPQRYGSKSENRNNTVYLIGPNPRNHTFGCASTFLSLSLSPLSLSLSLSLSLPPPGGCQWCLRRMTNSFCPPPPSTHTHTHQNIVTGAFSPILCVCVCVCVCGCVCVLCVF